MIFTPSMFDHIVILCRMIFLPSIKGSGAMTTDSTGSATPPHVDEEDGDMERGREEDEMSELSEESGKDWKPDMTGKLAWLHRCTLFGKKQDFKTTFLEPWAEERIPEDCWRQFCQRAVLFLRISTGSHCGRFQNLILLYFILSSDCQGIVISEMNPLYFQVLFNLLSEPEKRRKLDSVNTLEDVVSMHFYAQAPN